METKKRLIVIGTACLLLVAAIIGIAIGVSGGDKEKKGDAPVAGADRADLTSAGSKAITEACKNNTYSEDCNKELRANPSSLDANPRKLVSIAVQVALDHVQSSLYLAANLSTESGGRTESMAIGDCAELMDDAKDYLNQAITQLSSLQLKDFTEELYDVLVWLSTVSSFEDACNNGFNDVPTQELSPRSSAMKKDQEGLSKAITIAIDLVNSLAELGANLSSWKNLIPNIGFRRKVLSMDMNQAEADEEGFPHWLGAAERRLLTQKGMAKLSWADAVVGPGGYKTIQAAVDAIPANRKKRWVIYIKAGVYNEIVRLSKNHRDVTFLGDGPGKTIISGNRNVALQKYTTFNSATVALAGQGFIAKGVTFRNTAGAIAHQAVALRVSADYMVFYACSFEGYQDTLYAHAGRQFYRDCDIYGTVDYIFGNAIAVFQNCKLLARRPLKGQKNTYTAHGRTIRNDPSGYSFQGCSILPAPDLRKSPIVVYTYYGRPWRAYSRTVFIDCFVGALLHPDGWLPWDPSKPFINTVYYGEHKNRGPGSSIARRVKWGGVHSAMSASEASRFWIHNFLAPIGWIKSAGVPYY